MIFEHPYLKKERIESTAQRLRVIGELNSDRGPCTGEAVFATYYFRTEAKSRPLDGLANVARMALEHGTLKPWHAESDLSTEKPSAYDSNMSWVSDIGLFEYSSRRGTESGIMTIAWPLAFFDKRDDGRVGVAQMLEAVASEPISAFSGIIDGRLVDLAYPPSLRKRFIGPRWPNSRVREYLGLGAHEPMIGTIVKPKTGLTPGLFARAVVEAAKAGAHFTKADENMHLSLSDIARYVGATVQALRGEGFDVGSGAPHGKRFLFAPHITTDPDLICAYAQAAVGAGANALMFSPYYAGGFAMMEKVVRTFDVPIYAHTAGMNILTGKTQWGIDPRVCYALSALCGAAFMQLPAVNGYIRPFEEEKPAILATLRRDGLDGADGMTLAVAGGLGPQNIAANAKAYGSAGRMFLAGTSVYSHPDGVAAGVKALKDAYNA